MKKIFNCLILSFFLFTLCGCNKYIQVNTNGDGVNKAQAYYGAFNRRDITHADIILYEIGSDVVCDGVIHLNAPSRAITLKNDKVPAVVRIACTDEKLINANMNITKGDFAVGEGEGLDQYDVVHKFKTISKDEFKQKLPNKKIKTPNKDFILKY